MYPLADPLPVESADPHADLYTDTWLRELFLTSQNLSLIQREGAIQNYDKAGNLDAQYLVWTSNGSANTEDAVPHTLKRTPKGYIVVKQDKAASLYDSTTAFSSTYLYLKSSAATVAWTILVF